MKTKTNPWNFKGFLLTDAAAILAAAFLLSAGSAQAAPKNVPTPLVGGIEKLAQPTPKEGAETAGVSKSGAVNQVGPGLNVASAANYAFSTATNASLADMSTGTTTLVAANLDDTPSSLTNIGFDFFFQGVRFSQFGVNENGVLRLGAVSQTGLPYQPLAQASPVSIITAYGADQRTHTSGKVHFKVTGSAPSRVLNVEWLNTQSNFNSGGTADLTYQVRLYETTGVIEFVYGSMTMSTAGAASTDSQDPQIGFSSNSTAGTVGSVTAAQSGAPAPTYNGASASPTNNVYIAGSITVLTSATQGSRRIFSFTPPIPTAPTGLGFTGVTPASMTLTWTDSADEQAYAVYRSTDGTNYTFDGPAAQNATSYNATGLTPSITYFWQVYAVSEGALSTALSGSQATAAPGNITSNGTGGGNWSSAATWVGGIPTATDNVTVLAGDTVTIDSSNALSVTVQSGGILQFEATMPRTLTVTTSVTIDAGGTFRSNPAGTQTGHVLSVGTDLHNNGTLDFSTAGNLAGAGITFIGAANNAFDGTGGTTNVRTVTINKGTSSANILEMSPTNFTVRGVTTDTVVGGWLVLTNGTMKVSGTFAGTSRVFSTATYTIAATAGFWLNNPSYVVAAQAGNVTTSGLFRVSAGTFNHGTLVTHSLRGNTGAVFTINGGTINCAGQFSPQNAVTYTQTGGTLNVGTVGNSQSNFGTFELFSGTSTFTMSGGSINIVQASTGTTQIDYQNLASANITGGTLQVGTGATVTKFTFNVRGNMPSLVVDSTTNVKSASNAAVTGIIFGNLTVNTGSTYNVNNVTTFLVGPTVTNNGLITSTGASARFDFANAASMSYGGTGTFGTLATPFGGVGVSTNSTSLVTLNSPIVTTRVNLFQGGFVNSGQVTLGNAGASATTVQIGSAGLVTPGGSFDVSPVHNQGTGGEIIIYQQESVPRTTGVEVNPTRVLNTLSVANTNGITIAGGDLAVNGAAAGALTMTNARITTGANTLYFNSVAGTVVRSGNGYVIGNFKKSYSAIASKSFEVGTANGFSPVTVNATAGSFPTDFTVKAIEGAAPYVSGPNKLARYWTLAGSGITANLTFTYLATDVVGTVANYQFIKNSGGNLTTLPPTGTPTSTSATINGVTSFSEWTLAEPAAVQPGALQFSPPTYSISESGPSVDVTVTRTGGSDGIVGVSYTTNDVTAFAPGDYTTTANTLSWGAGDTADKIITIPIANDSTYEGPEDFTVSLNTPTGGASIGVNNPATVTITDNDTAPTFSISDVTQVETDGGTTNFIFTVTKTGSTALPSSVNFQTQDGSATLADNDYQTNSGPLTFSAVQTSMPITVLVNGDTTVEPNETFTVLLSGASGATISDASGLGTIINDDGPPATVYVGEDSPTDFTITTDVAPPGLSSGDIVNWNPGGGQHPAGQVNGLLFGFNAFTSIDAATTAVNSGGTVNVEAGLYTGDVNVNKFVTFRGAQMGVDPNDGSWNDTRTVAANEAIIHGAVNLSLQNEITFDGFTLERTATNEGHILIGSGNPTGVGTSSSFNIRHNRFVGTRNTGTAWAGIHTNFLNDTGNVNPGNQFIADENRFEISGTASGAGILVNANRPGSDGLGGTTITNNYVANSPSNGLNVNRPGAFLILIANYLFTDDIFTFQIHNAVISSNTVVNSPQGSIQVVASSFEDSSNVTVSNNTITNNVALQTNNFSQIDIRGPLTGTNFVTGNSVTLSGALPGGLAGIYGVRVRGTSATGVSNLTVNNNTLSGGNIGGAGNANFPPTSGVFVDTDLLTSGLDLHVVNNFVNGWTNAVSVYDTNGTGPGAFGNLPAGAIFQLFNNDLSSNSALGVQSDTGELVNASNNWWGTNVEASVAALTSGPVDFTPYLNVGTDTSGAVGFQGNFSTLHVTALGDQTGATSRVQEGIDSVDAGGTVKAHSGTYAGNVNATAKAVVLSAGASPGQVTINGNVTLDNNDTMPIEINGTSAASDYDNFVVNGTVTLGGATLTLSGTHTPTAGQTFKIVDNDASDPVTGLFDSRAEGSTFTFNGVLMRISYVGDTGNDVTLSVVSYTVTYDANGGTGSQTDPNSPYLAGSTVTVLGTGTITRTGYTFSGWNTAANGSGTSYSPGATFTINADTTLYAQWTINTYTVTYDGNTNTGGTAPVDPNSPYNYNSTVTVLGQGTLTKTGYTFSNWNTAADGSGTSYSPGATFNITANTALYAQWTINTYTVTYDGNTNTGGTAPVDPNSPYNYNSTVTVLGQGTLTKTNYTFSGWNTAANGSGTSYSPGATFNITANTTLYAQWTSIPAIVYVDDNWVGTTPGNDPDGGAGPASNFGYDAFATIQDGVNGVANPGTVIVYAGTYPEAVTVNKSLTMLGAQANQSANARFAAFVSGPNGPKADPAVESILTAAANDPASGANDTLHVMADNVTFNGFVVDGNNPSLNQTGAVVVGGINTNSRRAIQTEDAAGNPFPANNATVSYNIVQNFSQRGVELINGTSSGSAPATSGNLITQNLVRNFGLDGIVMAFNAYADVTFNTVITNDYPTEAGIWVQDFLNTGTPHTMNIANNNVTVGQDNYGGIWVNLAYLAAVNINNNTVNAAATVVTGSDFTYGIYVTSLRPGTTAQLNGNIVGAAGGDFDRGIALWNVGTSPTTTTLADNTVGQSVDGISFVYNDANFGPAGSSAAANVKRTTVSGASVGVLVDGSGSGANTVTMTVTNSTLSGNTAASGGAVTCVGTGGLASLTMTNSTLSENSPSGPSIVVQDAALTVGNSIFMPGNGGTNISALGSSTVTSLGYNLSRDAFGGFLANTGDQLNTDPMLGPLKNNGGPTFTHAPLNGSPALDKGRDIGPVSPTYAATGQDQRASARPVTYDASIVPPAGGDRSDIGALELAPGVKPQSAASWLQHGGAGFFPINLPLSGPAGIECRRGAVSGEYQVIVTFAQPITFSGADVTSGTGSVSGTSVSRPGAATSGGSGTQVTIDLTGVTNVQTIVIALFDVDDGVNSGDVGVRMGMLFGDVNGVAGVTVADVNVCKSKVGSALSPTNFRSDVNTSGAVTVSDVNLVKSQVGTMLPP